MSNETNTTEVETVSMNEAHEMDAAPTVEEQLQTALAERDQFKDKWTRALACVLAAKAVPCLSQANRMEASSSVRFVMKVSRCRRKANCPTR